MSSSRNLWNCRAFVAAFAFIGGTALGSDREAVLASIDGMNLSARVYADGTYSISAPGIAGPVFRSDVEAVVDSRVLRSSDYPQHRVDRAELPEKGGPGSTLTVTHTGLVGRPDLVCVLNVLRDQSWGASSSKCRTRRIGQSR